MTPYDRHIRFEAAIIGALVGLSIGLILCGTGHAETRLTVGAGAVNAIPTTPNGTWVQLDQKHGYDTLSLGLKTGLETTITEHWYIGAGYVSLGTTQAWTEAKSDEEFFNGKHGVADKYLKAYDRMQGGELYVGYQWQVEAFRPYLTAGIAQFWHRVTQTHDTQTKEGTMRAQDMTWHGTVRSWRVGGGLCYRWLCGEVTYYKGATPGTNYPISTDAVVPMLVLNIPLN